MKNLCLFRRQNIYLPFTYEDTFYYDPSLHPDPTDIVRYDFLQRENFITNGWAENFTSIGKM